LLMLLCTYRNLIFNYLQAHIKNIGENSKVPALS